MDVRSTPPTGLARAAVRGRQRPGALPPWLALITILKGMIGAGILSLPYVFQKVRLAVAVPGYFVVSTICAFSVWRLIQCKALLFQPEMTQLILSASDGDSASEPSHCRKAGRRCPADDFGLGPLALVASQTLGPAGVVLAGFGIVVSQLGFCVSYVHVIVETIGRPSLLGAYVTEPQLRIGLCVLLCFLCLIRRLDNIGRLSGVALLIYCYLLWGLIWWGGREINRVTPDVRFGTWLPVEWSGMGLWFGTTIFAQEAIVISQYVYDEMRLSDPRDFLPVLIGSFGICSVVSTFVGAFGYYCYGTAIKDVFYLNFPVGSVDTTVAEVVLSLVLLASFVLQLFPVVSFAEAAAERLKPTDGAGSSSDTEELHRSLGLGTSVALRWGLVVMSCCIAAYIPDLPCITGYSGSFAMSAIGFFLPPLCHTKARGHQLSPLDWASNVLLLSAGCAAVVFGVMNTSCRRLSC